MGRTKSKELAVPTRDELEKELGCLKKAAKGRRDIIARSKGFANSTIYRLNLEAFISRLNLETLLAEVSIPTPIVELPIVEDVVEPIVVGVNKKRGRPRKEKPIEDPTPIEPHLIETVEPMDMVVAFDTTASMNRYLEDVKRHVLETVPNMLSQISNLKIKVIAFGDYCDMQNRIDFGSAYQESEFTDDAGKLISFINGAKGTYGGDSDEFYELVIKKIVEETPWREGSNRIVLLIGDANPHSVGYHHHNIDENKNRNTIDWTEECKKAKEKGIKIDTLSISAETFYRKVSDITGGVHMPFKSSSKMSNIFVATAYATAATRAGDHTSRATFTTMSTDALSSGDDELIGTYKALSTKL